MGEPWVDFMSPLTFCLPGAVLGYRNALQDGGSQRTASDDQGTVSWALGLNYLILTTAHKIKTVSILISP